MHVQLLDFFRNSLWLLTFTCIAGFIFLISLFVFPHAISDECAQEAQNLSPPQQSAQTQLQEQKIFKPISLPEAISSTIYRQLEIKIANMSVYRQRGAVQEAAGPFDLIFNDQFDELYIDDEEYIPLGIKSNLDGTVVNNTVSATKQTRIGTIVTVKSDLTKIHDELLFLVGELPAPRVSLADVMIRVEQALLRGGLGQGISFQREKAAKKELEAVKLDLFQVISEKVRDTAIAYWNFVASIKTLIINKNAEKEFEDLLKKVARLIEAKEAAAGDIIQVQASLAIKKRNRIFSANALYVAMKQLLFAMGAMDKNLTREDCDFDQIIEVFPEYPKVQSNINFLHEFTDYLTENALISRFDVLASLTREKVAELILDGLFNSTLPQLNVFTEMTTRDFKVRDDARHLDSALYFKHPEFDWKVGVSLSVPFSNDEAIGAYKQGSAVLNQTILQTLFLKEQLIRDVLVTLQTQIDLGAQIEEANKAVAYYEKVVANETEKLTAGFTTLFELISYKNSLTDSLLLQNILYNQYSQNIANLRFFSGTLLKIDPYGIGVEELNSLPIPSPTNGAAVKDDNSEECGSS